jgi:sensor c-di-GMP phosphodiesterase-like protein
MDDFGTGYSSLAYLTQLPLDQLKIDQSFVRNIGTKSSDSMIVQTIIGMAQNLGIEVIAEGVETQAQRDFLEQAGCKFFQGYLYGKPVAIEKFTDSLAEMAT